MRRQAFYIILAAVMALLVGLPVLAQASAVQIISPGPNTEIRGIVTIRGSASVGDFQFYKVEYGVGTSPGQWAIVGAMHESPVVDGQLEVWDTTLVPDGTYTLRLQAVKQDGNYDEVYIRGIVVANSQPAPTPTEEETPTPSETVTPSPTPGEGTPAPDPQEVEEEPGAEATATMQIIAPSTALAEPTATPTLRRLSQTDDLPIDPDGWRQSFVYGLGAMALVFVIVGLILGLRRLI